MEQMTFGHYIHQGEAGKISQRKVIQPEASQMRGKPESTVPKPGGRRAKVKICHSASFILIHQESFSES